MKVSYSFTSFGDMSPVEGDMDVDPRHIRSLSDKELCEMKAAAELFWDGCCPDLDMPREIEVTETLLGE